MPDEWQARQATPAILQVSSSKHNAKKITTRERGPFYQSITCVCLCVCVSEEKLFYCDTNRYEVCFCRQVPTRLLSERHANLALLSLDKQQPSKPIAPQFSLRFFSFLSPVFGEFPPKHSLDQGSMQRIDSSTCNRSRQKVERNAITAFFLNQALAKSIW